VIVGAGACGRAAAAAARRAGSTIMFMRRRGPLDALLRWARRRVAREFFDRGSLGANKEQFVALYQTGRDPRGKGPRLFLAGDYDRDTRVRASALRRCDRVSSGVPPRHTNGSALEAQTRGQWFRPESLHKIWSDPDQAEASALPPDSFGPEVAAAIQALIKSNSHVSRQAPRPEQDNVLERHPGAMASIFLDSCDTVVIAPATIEKFDTAWIDPKLIGEYGREKVRRVVLLPGIIIIDPKRIERLCRRYRLDLAHARLR
jgi:hypothetical protein